MMIEIREDIRSLIIEHCYEWGLDLRDFLDKIENLLDNEKEDLDVIVPLILTQKLMHDIHYGEFNYEFVKNLLNNLE